MNEIRDSIRRAAIGKATETMAALTSGGQPSAQRCVDNIERIVRRRGGTISHAQDHLLRSCLRLPGVTCGLPGYRREPEGDPA